MKINNPNKEYIQKKCNKRWPNASCGSMIINFTENVDYFFNGKIWIEYKNENPCKEINL